MVLGLNGISLSRAPPVQPSRMRWLVRLLVALLVLAIASHWWWTATRPMRAIRALPDGERRDLYRRTMENLTSICDPAPGRSFRDFCREQATLILAFPECDRPCQRIARRHQSLPRR